MKREKNGEKKREVIEILKSIYLKTIKHLQKMTNFI